MTVLTFSGGVASGAREVSRQVAELLHIDYVDHRILLAAARALGVPTIPAASLDTRTAGLADRVPSIVRRFLERSKSTASMTGNGGLDVLLGHTYREVVGDQSSIDAVASAVQSEQPDLRPQAAPDGTVTLLFSDIEGSTALNERLGDQRWLELLREHNGIIRQRLAAHRGFEVKTEGDGFMIAFQSAQRALKCAVDIQRVFAQRNERAEEPVRVRIGLHTGEVIREADDFYGRHVNLASRIANEARGGEILVSSLVKELTEGATDIRFGGGLDVQLKGLTARHRVFQLEWGSPEVSAELYLATIRGIFRDLAAHDDVVILGRGSQMILGDWPGAVHVLIVARLDQRIQWLARREGLEADEAAKRVHDSDKAQAAFYRKYYKVDFGDPSLYHLTVNMDHVSVGQAARMISEFTQADPQGLFAVKGED